MKIGVICEGEYTDVPVIRLLLEHSFPNHHFLIKGFSKSAIFSAGDFELAKMYKDGAQRVLIVWDLLPTGYRMGVAAQWNEKPSRVEQRQKLLELLCHSQYLPEPVRQQAHYHAHRYQFAPFADKTILPPNGNDHLFHLVCVCYSLDGWLLADPGLLTEIARSAGPASVCRVQHPDECQNPVSVLKKYFGESRHRRLKYYNKADHNRVLADHYCKADKVDAMRTSGSFRRVVETIERWVGR